MTLTPAIPPRIAVVVPAFNVGRYIAACLASVVAQSEAGWTCIVVDDGSTDDTPDRVAAVGDPRVTLLRQANGGVSRARNAGLAAAHAEFVLFLDGDDVLHPTALARLAAALDRAPASVAAYGALRKILDDGSPYPGEKPLDRVSYPSGDVLAAMVAENFLANGGHVLIRADAARAAGGFDPRLRLSEDWEFWCRLALAGPFSFIGAPPEVFSLRVRPGSASGGLAADWDNHRAAIDAVLGNPRIRDRFAASAWRRLEARVWAAHLFEAGRVNFTVRNFAAARGLMLRSLAREVTPKRVALFGLAQLSQLANRSLVSRLRFRDDDIARGGSPG